MKVNRTWLSIPFSGCKPPGLSYNRTSRYFNVSHASHRNVTNTVDAINWEFKKNMTKAKAVQIQSFKITKIAKSAPNHYMPKNVL